MDNQILNLSTKIQTTLKAHEADFLNLLPHELINKKFFVFDLSQKNSSILELDFNSLSFVNYVSNTLDKEGCAWGIGRYNEDRVIYRQSQLFGGDEQRSIHLGIDLWAKAGTALFLPLAGKVHSLQNNAAVGDYGPTIIIEHALDEVIFFTLYGHLNPEVLNRFRIGDKINAGQEFANMGEFADNGHWPPHVHFQIIADMLGKSGDFPGVAKPSERDYWLSICLDPNLILRLPII